MRQTCSAGSRVRPGPALCASPIRYAELWLLKATEPLSSKPAGNTHPPEDPRRHAAVEAFERRAQGVETLSGERPTSHRLASETAHNHDRRNPPKGQRGTGSGGSPGRGYFCRRRSGAHSRCGARWVVGRYRLTTKCGSSGSSVTS